MKNIVTAEAETILLTKSDVFAFLSISECIDAVEKAFALHAEGRAMSPKILAIHVADGGFHIKAGVMNMGKEYFVAKTNANFPGNIKNYGLPTIQGVVTVFDAVNGKLLALLDSIAITVLRTGAATGVAAKHLSREDSETATICGCGNQGRISLKALLAVRSLKQVFAFDLEQSAMQSFVEFGNELGVDVEPVTHLTKATLQSDIIVTCTTSRKGFLSKRDVRPGTFIAAVGADSEEKRELESDLLKTSKIIVDLIDQSATIGELRHALKDGSITRAQVHAELGSVIINNSPGRTSEDEVIIFDSTGTALQDVAAASIVFEKAIASGFERRLNFVL